MTPSSLRALSLIAFRWYMCNPAAYAAAASSKGEVSPDAGHIVNHGHRCGQLPVFVADLGRPPQTAHVSRSHLTDGPRLAKG